MERSEFFIGGTFWCSGRQWRCTDIGSRTIIAIRIDSVPVGSNVPVLRRTLTRSEAEADGWFNGPPYAGAEVVFDEDMQPACSPERDEGAIDAEAVHVRRALARDEAGSSGQEFYDRIHAHFAALGGVELESPPREGQELLDHRITKIPAAECERFEAWAQAPAKPVPALRDLAAHRPAWQGVGESMQPANSPERDDGATDAEAES